MNLRSIYRYALPIVLMLVSVKLLYLDDQGSQSTN
jgi:hypothetical protein